MLAQLNDRYADERPSGAECADNPHHRAMLKLIERWRSDTQRLHQQINPAPPDSIEEEGFPAHDLAVLQPASDFA